jgi:hypothetical protein
MRCRRHHFNTQRAAFRHGRTAAGANRGSTACTGRVPAVTRVRILSLAALLVAILGLHAFHLAGSWRAAYVTAFVALWLNVSDLAVHIFGKFPAANALAPTPVGTAVSDRADRRC